MGQTDVRRIWPRSNAVGHRFSRATREQAGRPTLTQEPDLIQQEIPFFTPEDRQKYSGTNGRGCGSSNRSFHDAVKDRRIDLRNKRATLVRSRIIERHFFHTCFCRWTRVRPDAELQERFRRKCLSVWTFSYDRVAVFWRSGCLP